MISLAIWIPISCCIHFCYVCCDDFFLLKFLTIIVLKKDKRIKSEYYRSVRKERNRFSRLETYVDENFDIDKVQD